MRLQEIISKIPVKPYFSTPNGVLYCADNMDIMKYMPDKCVDSIITDPPYGISFVSSWTKRKESLLNDGLANWLKEMPKWLKGFKRIITDTGCCCCCCGGGGKTPVTAFFTIEAIKHFYLIQTLVWKKFIGLGWRYRPAYENIIILSRDKENYAFYDTTKSCSNVIENINQNIPNKDEHPTQKPLALMERLILTHTKMNDLVFEPFAGGGSTLTACEKLNRKYIGIEINEKYCMWAKERIKNEANQCKFNFPNSVDDTRHRSESSLFDKR